MPESELKEHEENCPSRILIDVAMYQSEDMIRPSPTVESEPSIKYEESWDGLEHTSEILKTIKTTTASMKATHNMTKSQRKQHRINLHENDINNVNDKGEKKQQNKLQETTPLFIGKRPNT
ncbi:gametocyte-specific factor 1 [Aphis craccivora]|uniref:Gametocyte-specific factor 1 n=1 Tax=Aphis craccivora TaxID=307492 RepID=A0A6G0ZLK9_APHCR|nr:gametocyte-specific factor 1 [Aphis craccivora]